MFHRDWADRAVLRTEVMEGMAGGSGCANSADVARGATTATLWCGGDGSFCVGCCHLRVEVPSESSSTLLLRRQRQRGGRRVVEQ